MPNIPKDLLRALRDIIPTDDFYVVDAEDEDYRYEIEISLSPRGDEYYYILLDFSYEEKT